MALKNCEECGKEISDKAPACPNCGAPVLKTQMAPQARPNIEKKKSKKAIYVIFFIIFLFVMAEIGADKSDKNKDNDRQPVSSSEGSRQDGQGGSKEATKDVDPCRNIKTVEDFKNASLLWQMANSECDPRNKEKNQKEEQKKNEFESRIVATKASIEEEIRKTIKPSKQLGDYDLELDIKENIYSAILIYPKDPMPMEAAEMVSKAAVLAMVKVLVGQGKDIYGDWTGIHASVYTRLEGVSGKKMAREYGVASYNFNTDEIVWSN